MKNIDVYGVGNAIVDILLQVSDTAIAECGFTRGTMTLVEEAEQHRLLRKFEDNSAVLVSGGSVANSVIAVSQLGGKSAYACCIGDDRYGLHYHDEMRTLGVHLSAPPHVGQHTGTCVILVEPHGERTMRTCLAAASRLSEREIDAEVAAHARWMFLEGYVLANGASGVGAHHRAISAARQAKTHIALTLSDTFVVNLFREQVDGILPLIDLVFTNESEALAYTKQSSAEAAFRQLCLAVPNVVMTLGARGTMIRYRGEDFTVPAVKCTPVDLTGAGDMFAGAFLYGVSKGFAPEESARGACYLAMKVITQMGARLESGVKEHWSAAVAG